MFVKRHLVLAVTAAVFSSSVMAGLTISPAIQGSMSVTSQDAAQSVQVRHKATAEGAVKGNSSAHGYYEISEKNQEAAKVYRYGENAPLFMALEKVVPDSGSWNIKVEQGLENHPISWNGGDTWEGVVNTIAEQNNLGIVVNHAEKVIGVARKAKVADAMASQDQRVFRLNGEKSLRENLSDWAKQAGYEDVVFTREVRNLEYPVFNAVFLGKLNAKGGALDQLLLALNEDAQTPLKADFREGNGIILIRKLTSSKEMY